MDEYSEPARTRSRTGCFTCRKRKKKCDELLYPVCQNCNDRNLTCKWPLKKHEVHKKLEEVKYIGNDEKTSKIASGDSTNVSPNFTLKKQTGTQQRKARLPGIIEDNTQYKSPSIIDESEVLTNVAGSENKRVFGQTTTLDDHPDPAKSGGQQEDRLHGNIENIPSGFEAYASEQGVRHPQNRKVVKPYTTFYGQNKPHKRRNSYFLERIAMQQDCVDPEVDSLVWNESIAKPSPSSDLYIQIDERNDISPDYHTLPSLPSPTTQNAVKKGSAELSRHGLHATPSDRINRNRNRSPSKSKNPTLAVHDEIFKPETMLFGSPYSRDGSSP